MFKTVNKLFHKEVVRKAVASWTQDIIWTDHDNKKESIVFTFYVHSNGKRSCEYDYRGWIVENQGSAKNYNHIIRHWVDAGIFPQGVVIFDTETKLFFDQQAEERELRKQNPALEDAWNQYQEILALVKK